MVHFNIVRPRQDMTPATPGLAPAQAALIASVWLGMIAAFALVAFFR